MTTATIPDFKKYPGAPEEECTAPYRKAAHYLDWAAKHHPNCFTPWPIVTRIVHARSSTPRDKSVDVAVVRKTASRVRRHLMANYNRELENVAGVGVRATTGSLDVIKSRVTVRVRAHESAVAGLQATAALVDLESIKDTAESRPIKEWFRKVLPGLNRLDGLQKLLALPPALLPNEGDGGGEGK